MKCYNCGHEQNSGRFCDRCGMMITKIKIEDETSDEYESARERYEDERPQNLRCKCGHIQTQGKFCEKCGMMLDYYRAMPEEDLPEARCPQCGGMSTKPVCGNCGIKIPGFPWEVSQ